MSAAIAAWSFSSSYANHGSHRSLTGERIGLEGGKEQGDVGHVLDRGEFLVHGLRQHDLLDDALLADAELLVACSGICFSTSGVLTNPGQITLARTLCAAPSLAITRAKPSSPCFAAT